MTSLENLFESWYQFRRGKRKKLEVQIFERHLEDNLFQLHEELRTFHYRHGPYDFFNVYDPKKRHIGKACVKDRLVHQMMHATLSQIFDSQFIFHSLSSRLGKGTHLGLDHLERMIRRVSANGKKPCFALKMDIKKFFDSIDHIILKTLLRKKLGDEKVLMLVDLVVDSLKIKKESSRSVGLPLGNVTSQLFANIYLHELDHFVKHVLRIKFYLRFCDDFIFILNSEAISKDLIPIIKGFLKDHLRLELHPKKVTIRKLSQGIDFVGYIFFAKHRLLRSSTERRMKRRLQTAYVDYIRGNISDRSMDQRLQSYLGLLSHTNQATLAQTLKNAYWVRSLD